MQRFRAAINAFRNPEAEWEIEEERNEECKAIHSASFRLGENSALADIQAYIEDRLEERGR